MASSGVPGPVYRAFTASFCWRSDIVAGPLAKPTPWAMQRRKGQVVDSEHQENESPKSPQVLGLFSRSVHFRTPGEWDEVGYSFPCGAREKWCRRAGLNCRPQPYQGCALPLSYGGEKGEAGAIAVVGRPVKPQSAAGGLTDGACRRTSSPWADRTINQTRPPRVAKRNWRRRCARTCAGARLLIAPSRRLPLRD